MTQKEHNPGPQTEPERSQWKAATFHDHYATPEADSKFLEHWAASRSIMETQMKGIVDGIDQHGGKIVHRLGDCMVVETPKTQMQHYLKAARGQK